MQLTFRCRADASEFSCQLEKNLIRPSPVTPYAGLSQINRLELAQVTLNPIVSPRVLVSLSIVDWLIMLVYFVFVLGIGFALKRYMRTSNDFFLAGRSIPAWVCGLAFISANLGAQEVIGMGASGANTALSPVISIGSAPSPP